MATIHHSIMQESFFYFCVQHSAAYVQFPPKLSNFLHPLPRSCMNHAGPTQERISSQTNDVTIVPCHTAECSQARRVVSEEDLVCTGTLIDQWGALESKERQTLNPLSMLGDVVRKLCIAPRTYLAQLTVDTGMVWVQLIHPQQCDVIKEYNTGFST